MSKRIQKKVSRTAQMVCFIRAISYYETEESYKSDDYLSPSFLPLLMKAILKFRILREKVKQKLSISGMYEYIVGRTKVIDLTFSEYSGQINQVVILGAGFDSRGIRFNGILNDTIIYELDAYETQQFKINKINKEKIAIPKNLKMIPIDFENEPFIDILIANGFKRNEPCLFLLEGLTMFIDPVAIPKLFKDINDLCGKDSIIVFDYLHEKFLSNEISNQGSVTETVSSLGEKYKFGIEKSKIKEFTIQYGFELLEEYDANQLNNAFFSKEKSKNSKPIDLYSIVIAKKVKD